MLNMNKKELLNEIYENYQEDFVVEHYKAGQTIVAEGEECDKLRILYKGKAVVIPSKREGISALIEFLDPGDFIGDFEIFNDDNYFHTVAAKVESIIISFDKEDLDRVFQKIYLLNMMILNLSDKLRQSSVKAKYISTLDATERVKYYLYDHAVENVFMKELQYKDIASSVNVSERHLRRILTKLEEDDLVKRDGKKIELFYEIEN